MPSSLSWRQRLFINAYLSDPTANEVNAAKVAGYKVPAVAARRLLRNPLVRWAVEARVRDCAIKADEVLARFSEVAQFDPTDFLEFSLDEETGRVRPYYNLERLKRAGKGHMIKKVKILPDGNVELEFHDSQAALDKLAKHHGIFRERIEIEQINGSSGTTQRVLAVLGGLAQLSGATGFGAGLDEAEPRALCGDSVGREVDAGPALDVAGQPVGPGGVEDTDEVADRPRAETWKE